MLSLPKLQPAMSAEFASWKSWENTMIFAPAEGIFETYIWGVCSSGSGVLLLSKRWQMEWKSARFAELKLNWMLSVATNALI